MASNEVRKLRRRMAGAVGVGYGQLGPAPAGFYEAELDRRRQYFTEELVKLGVEELNFRNFSGTRIGTTEPAPTLEEWFLAITKAAKVAAEELYPELPEEEAANVG